MHSKYVRQLADRSVGVREARIRLQVKKFRCLNSGCPRKIFAEQPDGRARRYQRRSTMLTDLLTRVGLALGGRAGHRMSRHIAAEVSRSTLLRLVRALPVPQAGELPAVGVDDFAIRKGHIYGTVIIDMATHRPVDLLEERTSDTVAEWMAQHPEIRVVCRDRGGPYADGASRGAPDAIQVADRWHLLHNLAKIVDKLVRAHRKCLVAPVAPADTEQDSVAESPAPPPRTAATRARYQQIHELLDKGVNITTISEKLQLDRKTVRRYAHAGTADELLARTGRRGSILDEHIPYLRQRWGEGCTNALWLYTELREQRGFTGSQRSVRRLLQTWRVTVPQTTTGEETPTPRDVTGWMMRPVAKLSDDDIRRLRQILDRCDTLHQVNRLVSDFAGMARERGGKHLDTWIAAARNSGINHLAGFADGLLKDYDAVRNGLTLHWSSGAVEGNVNRVKMFKRTMYGRAKFDLLRARVLLSE